MVESFSDLIGNMKTKIEGKNKMLTKEFVKGVIENQFDLVSKGFKEVPSAENFLRLQAAMYALQCIRNRSEEQLLSILKNKSSIIWIDHLVIEYKP
jgi:hypothetical protein